MALGPLERGKPRNFRVPESGAGSKMIREILAPSCKVQPSPTQPRE